MFWCVSQDELNKIYCADSVLTEEQMRNSELELKRKLENLLAYKVRKPADGVKNAWLPTFESVCEKWQQRMCELCCITAQACFDRVCIRNICRSNWQFFFFWPC